VLQRILADLQKSPLTPLQNASAGGALRSLERKWSRRRSHSPGPGPQKGSHCGLAEYTPREVAEVAAGDPFHAAGSEFCGCFAGMVTLTIEEDEEEIQVAVPCRSCEGVVARVAQR
jgi:hypothetical protein